jgi:hypothetical protein
MLQWFGADDLVIGSPNPADCSSRRMLDIKPHSGKAL